MTEYHKIETIFKREMGGNKKLIEGKFRNPIVEYLKDNEWYFTEKIDGTNIRVIWDGHNVSFKGRTDKAQIPKELLSKLEELFCGETNEEVFEQKFGNNQVVLYGEGYGAKIQKGGGNYSDSPEFILFDVKIGDIFLERENVVDIAKSLNIDVVPILGFTKLTDAITYVKSKPISQVGKKIKEIEGVIGIPKQRIFDSQGNRVIMKIKVCDFTK